MAETIITCGFTQDRSCLAAGEPRLYARKNIRSIIQNQTTQLSNQFEIIKEIITTQDIFSNLSSICSFNEKKESITFKTEKIHPHQSLKRKTSVILLFSNPHPISVQSGLLKSS